MDAEDQLRKFLQTTGWSCDDLLKKIEKLKSREEPESISQLTESSDECLVDSTQQIAEPSFSQSKNETEQENRVVLRKTIEDKNCKDFSDTDEDEAEVSVTNSNIIEEIIEDISTSDNERSTTPVKSNVKPQSASLVNSLITETPEVTEIEIIEINADDDDDKFEDECHATTRLTPERLEELEKLSRELSCNKHSNAIQTFEHCDGEIVDKNQNCTNRIESQLIDEPQKTKLEISKKPQDKVLTNETLINLTMGAEESAELTENLIKDQHPEPKLSDISKTPVEIENENITSTDNLLEKVPIILTEENNTISTIKGDVLPKELLNTENNHSTLPFSKDKNNADDDTPPSVEDPLSEDDQSPELLDNETPKVYEDIRNNLRLQLSSLRTKKKGSFLSNLGANRFENFDKQKTDKPDTKLKAKELDNLNEVTRGLSTSAKSFNMLTTKPVSISNEPKPTNKSVVDFNVAVNTCEKEEIKQTEEQSVQDLDVASDAIADEELYTQTNELGIVISSVQGGVELETLEMAEDENLKENDEEEKNNSIGVFAEIRKIIQKQRLSNSSPEKVGTKMNTRKLMSSSAVIEDEKNIVRNNSFISSTDNSLSSFNLEDSNQNSENYSPFVSNTLDEFLTENSKLNISYKVPKCGAEEGLKERYEERPLVLKKTSTIKRISTGEPKTSQKIKAKTLAQKRKILERQHKLQLKQQEKLLEKDGTIVKTEGRDFVMYEGKKLGVETVFASKKCIAIIDSPMQDTLYANRGKRKLSLLVNSKQPKINYRPGPLCKKPRLQLSGKENWEVMMKNLPKLFVEVTPSLGKPMPPNIIHHLPGHDGSLNSEQIEFALSAVNSNANQSDVFQFPIKYRNNQEQVVVRKEKPRPNLQPMNNECPNRESADSSDKAVKDVINNLLNYIDTKELEPTLIKEDQTVPPIGSDVQQESKPVDKNITIGKKRKKSKFDLELKRLSCKVVNVELEEKEESICNKTFCKLGCICKSLRCDTLMSLHCQKYQCMFDCKCPKEKTVVLESKLTSQEGIDVLSKEAVDRIEDEAKKHLAKVEKEFTQTVIHTNDNTIVVGLATRHKTRRNTKTPLKYSDFVDSDSVEKAQDKKKTNAGVLKNCKVFLNKLNLPQIVPYCLVHQIHNCHCIGGVISYQNGEFNNGDQKQPNCIIPHKKQKSSGTDLPATSAENSPEVSTGRPIRIRKPKMKDNFEYFDNEVVDSIDCARLRGVGIVYFKKQAIDQKIYQNDFVNNITESDLSRYESVGNKDNNEFTECELVKRNIIAEVLQARNAFKELNKVKDMAEPKQKKKKIVENNSRRPVFDDERIVDQSNMELLQTMGPRVVADGYARLLPWSNLLEGFQSGAIKIWCMKDQTSKLMMNKAEYNTPPKNYVDIREAEYKTTIIRCILNNKTPPGHEIDSACVILRETKSNFEICGMFERTNKSFEEKELTFVHRDMAGEQRLLMMRKDKYKLQELVAESMKDAGESSIKSTKFYMWAALPEIYDVCKWRLIYLNSDFTYLFFKKINYSIKYTDLVDAGLQAKEHSLTVMLRNKEIQNYYNHKVFGIYFDPHYQDRIFLGPYFKTSKDDDVATLRYSNGTLMCSESFNKMRGEGNYKCGHWLIERSYKCGGPTTIDLTKEKEDENVASNQNSEHMFIHNNHEVKIINTTPKSPGEFNRFVITNIPHFGYLGAYQHPNSEIDLQWPFEMKLLRFHDTKNAVDYLQKRLSMLLVSVPHTFKISVLLLTSIDFNSIPPIRSDVLNGQYICGDFGYYNIRSLSNENYKEKTGFTKEEILRAFAMKTEAIVGDRAKGLASLLEMSEKHTLEDVVGAAKALISKLRNKNKRLACIKSKLLREKKNKAAKLFSMIGQLQPEQKYKESKRLISIMNSTQPIEIIDSDEEKDPISTRMPKSQANNATAQSSNSKPWANVPAGSSVLIRGNGNTRKYIQGIKLVRNPAGNLVLVSDKNGTKKSPLTPGTKVMLKNNKIQAIRKLDLGNSESATGDSAKKGESRLLVKNINVSENNANTFSVKSSTVIDLSSEGISNEACNDSIEKEASDLLDKVTTNR